MERREERGELGVERRRVRGAVTTAPRSSLPPAPAPCPCLPPATQCPSMCPPLHLPVTVTPSPCPVRSSSTSNPPHLSTLGSVLMPFQAGRTQCEEMGHLDTAGKRKKVKGKACVHGRQGGRQAWWGMAVGKQVGREVPGEGR